MRSFKRCRFGFDPWGLGLFLLIMVPNLVWSAYPAPNDVLRARSVTPLLDAAAQVFQIVMVAALCGVVNTARSKSVKRGWAAGAILCTALYFAGWAAYYAEVVDLAVILTLYLLTGHTSFYERCGWEFLCTAQGEGDMEPSRIYVHKI